MTESSSGNHDGDQPPERAPSPSEVATGAEDARSVESENDVATPEFGGAYQGPVEPPEQTDPKNDVANPEFGGAYQGPVEPPDADE